NDYRAYLSGDLALGDVAGNRVDGCGRADFVSAEMEFDRQDFSWIEDEQGGEQRVPDELGRNRINFHGSGDLPGPILQHGNSRLSLFHRDPALAAVDAGRAARAGRNKLG